MRTERVRGSEHATATVEIAGTGLSFVTRLRKLIETLCARFRGARQTLPAGADVAPETRQRIGAWRVLEVLGTGTSATVFRVVPAGAPVATATQFALKLHHRRFSGSAEAGNRFRRETRILRSIRHRNIVQLVETGEHEGCPFLVMEMVEGQSLRDALVKHQPKLKGKLDWAIQICRALSAMHERGIVHRDLKPENILTTRVGFIKIADFGLARTHESAPVTRAGFLVGTPAYMAPEYLRGEEPDTRSDLYSLGLILYELFTGAMPYEASSVNDFLHAHLAARPIPPRKRTSEVPHELESIILRLLEKRPSRRYQSAEEVREALETLLAHVVGVEASSSRRVA